MAKLVLPKATENQAVLGPEMVILASPPVTLAFNLTSQDEDYDDYQWEIPTVNAFLEWDSPVSLSRQALPHRIQ